MANEEDKEILEEVNRFERMLSGNKEWFDADDYLNIIDYYLLNNEESKAEIAVSYAIKLFPDNEDIKLRLVAFYSRNRQFDKAITFIENYLKDFSPNVPTDLYHILASIYIESGTNYDKALEILLRLVNDKQYADQTTYNLLGEIYINKNKDILAEKYLRLSLMRDSENSDTMCLYLACVRDKRLKKRITTFLKTLVEQNPYSYVAWDNLGTAYFRYNMYDQALQAFDYSIAIDDDSLYNHYMKGIILFQQNKFRQAIDEFLKTEKYHNNLAENLAEIYDYIACCYRSLNDYKQAIRYYKQCGEADNYKNTDTYFNIATCYKELGKENLFQEYFNKAMDNENIDEEEKIYMAEYLYDNDYKKESEDIYEELLLNEDDNIVEQSSISLATKLADDNKILKAINLLDNSLYSLTKPSDDIYYAIIYVSCFDEKYRQHFFSALSHVYNKKNYTKQLKKHFPNLLKNKIYKKLYKEFADETKD